MTLIINFFPKAENPALESRNEGDSGLGLRDLTSAEGGWSGEFGDLEHFFNRALGTEIPEVLLMTLVIAQNTCDVFKEDLPKVSTNKTGNI